MRENLKMFPYAQYKIRDLDASRRTETQSKIFWLDESPRVLVLVENEIPPPLKKDFSIKTLPSHRNRALIGDSPAQKKNPV